MCVLLSRVAFPVVLMAEKPPSLASDSLGLNLEAGSSAVRSP